MSRNGSSRDRSSSGRARPDAARAEHDGDADGWDVYIACCADATLYTGIARDARARIEQHNAGRGARYTRGRGPVELVYRERAAGRGLALRREAEIKALSAAAKRLLIASAGTGKPGALQR